MPKTVIFGGTFNPVHRGHVMMAECVAKLPDVEKIMIIPTKIPVHKTVGTSLVSGEHRLKMCELAFSGTDKCEISRIELDSKAENFTYNTVTSLKSKNPDTEYALLVGGDSFVKFDRWYKHELLLKSVQLIVFRRVGCSEADFCAAYDKLVKLGADIKVMDDGIPDVSSSEIRESLISGGSAEKLIPKAVSEYITDNLLYTEESVLTADEYKEILQKKLTPKRYYHSLCVADEAVRLAKMYGADPEKAFYAGLLHDIMKDTPNDEQLQMMREMGISLSAVELNAPKLWHAISGSEYLKRKFGFDDDIVSAVRYHTTAKTKMTPLETVLYLADFTSADRDYDGVEEMREAVDISVQKAMRVALQFTVTDLAGRSLPIHPDTLEAYNEIMLKGE